MWQVFAAHGIFHCISWALQLWHAGSVAPWHVGILVLWPEIKPRSAALQVRFSFFFFRNSPLSVHWISILRVCGRTAYDHSVVVPTWSVAWALQAGPQSSVAGWTPQSSAGNCWMGTGGPCPRADKPASSGWYQWTPELGPSFHPEIPPWSQLSQLPAMRILNHWNAREAPALTLDIAQLESWDSQLWSLNNRLLSEPHFYN